MKKIILLVLLLVIGGWFFLNRVGKKQSELVVSQNPTPGATMDSSKTTVVAEGLDTPWALAFLPASPAGGEDGEILVTERLGKVSLVKDDKVSEVGMIGQVKEIGEGGLMGLALDPDFSKNNFIFLYYTYGELSGNTLNKVVRMTYEGKSLKDEEIIVDKIPGAPNHNGGRIKFGPDKALYITTGDAQNPSLSQDKNSLAGKILRVVGNKVEVYSYGHRNPQGLAWDGQGQLWEVEHGPSGGSLGTGNDEVNKIEMGKNYGWPQIQGNQTKEGMETPFLNSTPNTTWAPAGAAILGDKLYFAGLRGSALYSLDIKTNKLTEYFKGEFGRIREVIVGPDNMLYISTSNLDGRGFPKAGDDKIIKINPAKL